MHVKQVIIYFDIAQTRKMGKIDRGEKTKSRYFYSIPLPIHFIYLTNYYYFLPILIALPYNAWVYPVYTVAHTHTHDWGKSSLKSARVHQLMVAKNLWKETMDILMAIQRDFALHSNEYNRILSIYDVYYIHINRLPCNSDAIL